ncbi:hypothetical protein GCM10009117_15670 [Gangjinia marincola]|uniref:Polyketide cyclase n=1 Tax=Gangjinia marincola TaxID=578463 RepID=A0ABN1MGV6_9FLAO
MKTSAIILLTTITLQAQNQRNFSHTIQTNNAPEAIWSIWTNVDQWHEWDIGLKSAEMNEVFSLGAREEILSLEGQKSSFKVVEFVEDESYTMKVKLPLGSMLIKRFLTYENEKNYFTHQISFKGLTGGIFARMLGKKFKTMLPQAMQNIEILANSRS